jgi:hypothetical protein
VTIRYQPLPGPPYCWSSQASNARASAASVRIAVISSHGARLVV